MEREIMQNDQPHNAEILLLAELYDQLEVNSLLRSRVAAERRTSALLYFGFTALLFLCCSFAISSMITTILSSGSMVVIVSGTVGVTPLAVAVAYFVVQSLRLAHRWRKTGLHD